MLYTRVFFRAVVRTDFGERVAVVGSSPSLGNWQANRGHELTTNEDVFPSWFSKEPVYLPLKKPVSYKYAILDERGDIVRWEECEGNRELVPTGVEMTVEDDDGLFREQMTNRGDHGVEGDDDVSVAALDKEEVDARNRVLAIQEEEPEFDENDSLIVCALDLPLRVVRVAQAPCEADPRPGDSAKDAAALVPEKRPGASGEYGSVPSFAGVAGAEREKGKTRAAASCGESEQSTGSPRKGGPPVSPETERGFGGGPVRSRRGTFEVRASKSALLPSLYHLRKKTRLPVRFIGWPGIHVEDEREQEELVEFLRAYDCTPIFPDKEEFDRYLTFCHGFLWPLFHNVVILDSKTQVPFDSDLWARYQAVNKLWADTVLRHAHETDMIWVHDYHLLLAPMHITRKVRRANVGFFLHIPFPSSEIFRCLPCREDILRGMLCADLIGFHLFEYARHFLVACKRLLGLEHHFCRGGILSIEYGGRNVSVRIGHVHIQYADIREKIEASPRVLQMSREIRQRYVGKFIFVSVDRCEKLAGLLLKVRAFQTFLMTYSYARGNVVLIQYAYPTIKYAEDTETMAMELQELVEKVNAQFALPDRPDFKHIELHIQSVGWEEKWAVFIAGDCFLDTSIRDGLNLNPFEYICCHQDNVTGVILSEFTGCSRALASAIRVNPWKVEAVADAMDRTINMPMEEQRDRFTRDQDYLSHNSTQKWADENILDLRRARKPDDFVYVSWGLGNTFRVLGMDSNFRFLDTNQVVRGYRTSRHRVFFFDCEGTLAPDRRRITFVPGGENLFAQGRPPSQQVKDCLQALVDDQRNTVVILSGRNRHLLEEWFSSVKGIGLCAEHGFYYRVPGITGDQWHCMSRQTDFTWKQVAIELMLQYVKRTQGSFIENKGSALVFQYRDADPDFGSMQAKDLSNYLGELLFGYPVSVMSGKGYVEVKLRGVNKGHAVEKVLRKLSNLHGDVDFVLCVGDDRSDEDMFAVINTMTEDGYQLCLPEGSGAGSSGLYRHTQSKDRIPRRNSVSSDENRAEGAPGSLEGTMKRVGSMQRSGGLGGTTGLTSASSSTSLCGAAKKTGPHFFTCTVGKKPSNARYYLNDTDDVSDLLDALQQCTEKDGKEQWNSARDSGLAAPVAAAAAAGSLAGNAAVQLRKGDSVASFASLWKTPLGVGGAVRARDRALAHLAGGASSGLFGRPVSAIDARACAGSGGASDAARPTEE
ncbi:trehalose-6-phosphate synthase of likely plant origin, related [Neospora caninum Liverpool]|uniref:Trehalose-6-phosphate synthase of likely plant origin, related n=1 Tax=Neospora caninum (strain Liverpool) TaxID=572307 RepID=F0V8Z6_NEOCL|nr:trehalose-6-phosphate synthase of likely plant origin, related [Neospora caninum Liverpool]CBZ50187.1 trehalose-6-phosphate synthase of likely plant origin, related [Neospora caninum Liverpool]CEL64788.1 TPA: Trehalose-6-phosphate synthase of likely plant origin, related [Neospora caninum Liverpool]|eukprot:XP_003880222.1 trehalose-6-phosphate synthase of likely plant origin, related [Neospora caninum Liverpool]